MNQENQKSKTATRGNLRWHVATDPLAGERCSLGGFVMSSKMFFVFGAVVAAALLMPNAARADLVNPLDPYTFDGVGLTNGSIYGQDGWAGSQNFPLIVSDWTGAGNHSKVVGSTFGQSWRFSDNVQVVTGTVSETYQFYSSDPANYWSFAGAQWGTKDGYHGQYGFDGNWALWSGNTEVKSTIGGPEANKWYEVKLVVDVSSGSAIGSMYYRNVTDGQTDFTAITDLANIAMAIPKFDGVYKLSGITAYASRNSGNGYTYYDNFNTIPEPSTISLLATGLIGLLAYAWRKRK
jgi:hypothetical protein